MFTSSPARWLAALPVLIAWAAVAQPAPASSPPPSLSFRSAMEGYQPFADEKAIPWKEANDTVHQRGGWRGYAKEASEEGGAQAAPATDTDPHAGHAMPMPAKGKP